MEQLVTDEEAIKKREEGIELLKNKRESYVAAQIYLHLIMTADYWLARNEINRQKDKRKLLRKIAPKKYYKGYELDIDHYTEHYLYSNKHLLNEAVYRELCEFYTPKKCKYLPMGCTKYSFPMPSDRIAD